MAKLVSSEEVSKMCVDGNTEFFNGIAWKKIRDYSCGEGVLTYYPEGVSKVEVPQRYAEAPANEPFYQYISNTFDICMGASQTIAYYDPKKGCFIQKMSCGKIFEKWQNDINGFRGRIPLTFKLDEKVDIDENLLRVAVMINADGSCQYKTVDGEAVVVRVYKDRKIKRCRQLLANAGISYKETIVWTRKMPGVSFKFRFPFNPKHFPKEWIYLSMDNKKAFLDELPYWDGSVVTCDMPSYNGTDKSATARLYWSSKKDDIDLVQMIAHSCGSSASIRKDSRYKQINYRLSLKKAIFSRLAKKNPDPRLFTTGEFEKVRADKKYCLETTSGFVVLRRNDRIFIAGSCQ